MDSIKITEKVGAGLRAIEGLPPDFLLFCEKNETEWTWDEEFIYCTPVLHSAAARNTHADAVDENVPFLPIWKNEATENSLNEKRFTDAYVNHK